MFQVLEYISQVLKYIFQDLKHNVSNKIVLKIAYS